MSFRRLGVSYSEQDDIIPCNLTKSSVEDYAGTVASSLALRPGQDLSPAVESFGGKIHYQQLDDWLHEPDSIFVHAPFDFNILLPQYTSPRRDRFTIAHELGHYFLHSRQGEIPIIARRSGSGRVEWEANWFAAALLMPADAVRAEYQKTKSNSRLAVEFGVSITAIDVRLKVLDLVS